MAELLISGWEGGFTWRIKGLGDAFNPGAGYYAAGLTRHQFTVGPKDSISGIIEDSVIYAEDGYDLTYTPDTDVYPYEAGTYTVWAWVQLTGGAYWPAGGGTFTVTEEEAERPNDWSWRSTIEIGGEIGLTAYEWNRFCNRINDFRGYKDLDEYDFTTAVSGETEISAAICNEAWYAINGIRGHGDMPDKAVAGNPLYADFFNGLMDALNAIS